MGLEFQLQIVSTIKCTCFLLDNGLVLEFKVQKCSIKGNSSYTDWENKVLPDSNIKIHLYFSVVSSFVPLTSDDWHTAMVLMHWMQ